ncbi:hypothetical protein PoB_005096500 [Plakobranchus ocellatus]|uniref:Uncharacterized protein n=1 Tax=Plakobranchus ocellatus TaxID=259542 RepID=A0AAV4BVH2_9GAST|nr:hypothetical protein PoB_005096500 [Plakobranchus ocellatus]
MRSSMSVLDKAPQKKSMNGDNDVDEEDDDNDNRDDDNDLMRMMMIIAKTAMMVNLIDVVSSVPDMIPYKSVYEETDHLRSEIAIEKRR